MLPEGSHMLNKNNVETYLAFATYLNHRSNQGLRNMEKKFEIKRKMLIWNIVYNHVTVNNCFCIFLRKYLSPMVKDISVVNMT